jgi:hypothetical protein
MIHRSPPAVFIRQRNKPRHLVERLRVEKFSQALFQDLSAAEILLPIIFLPENRPKLNGTALCPETLDDWQKNEGRRMFPFRAILLPSFSCQ